MHLFTDRACEVAFFCRFCCLFRHRKTIHEKPYFPGVHSDIGGGIGKKGERVVCGVFAVADARICV
jgi:hypothetical protein